MTDAPVDVDVDETAEPGRVPRFAYFEWSADPRADLDDRREWLRANPAVPKRVNLDDMADERQALIGTPEVFARELMGIVEDTSTGGTFTAEQWEAQFDETSEIVGSVAWTVDVTPDRGRAAIGAVGWRDDGDLHLEVVDHQLGTSWVVPRLVAMWDRHLRDHPDDACAVVIAPGSPAGSLIAEAEEAGLEVLKPGGVEYAHACEQTYDRLVDSHSAWHLDTPELRTAALGVKKKDNGQGAFFWDRRHPGVDISPFCAVTLGVWGIAQLPEPPKTGGFFSWADLEELARDEPLTPPPAAPDDAD